MGATNFMNVIGDKVLYSCEMAKYYIQSYIALGHNTLSLDAPTSRRECCGKNIRWSFACYYMHVIRSQSFGHLLCEWMCNECEYTRETKNRSRTQPGMWFERAGGIHYICRHCVSKCWGDSRIMVRRMAYGMQWCDLSCEHIYSFAWMQASCEQYISAKESTTYATQLNASCLIGILYRLHSYGHPTYSTHIAIHSQKWTLKKGSSKTKKKSEHYYNRGAYFLWRDDVECQHW